MDMPITVFGSGRKWYKAYTKHFGEQHDTSIKIADYALSQNNQWIGEITKFHQKKLNKPSYLSKKIKGAQINELYFIVGGGSVWVTKPVKIGRASCRERVRIRKSSESGKHNKRR